MKWLEDVQVLAFYEVTQKQSFDYFTRKVKRWYSSSFGVPLNQVDDLPIMDVMQHYFEDQFEGMADERLEEARQRMILDPAEEAARKDADAIANLELEKMAPEKLLKKVPKQKPPAPEKPKEEFPIPEMPDDIAGLKMDFSGLGNLDSDGVGGAVMDPGFSLEKKPRR